MPEVRKLQVVGKFGEGTVKSVNGVLPDDIGNVELKMETADDAVQMLVEMEVIQPYLVDDCILVDASNNVLTV